LFSEASSDGTDNEGNPVSKSSLTEVTFEIKDFDNNPPVFCSGNINSCAAPSPLYTTTLYVGDTKVYVFILMNVALTITRLFLLIQKKLVLFFD